MRGLKRTRFAALTYFWEKKLQFQQDYRLVGLTSCSLVNIYCHHFQCRIYCGTWNVFYQTSWCHISKEDIFVVTATRTLKSLSLNFSLKKMGFNPLNAELNPSCYLLALLGAHHFLHVSRIRVKTTLLNQLCSIPFKNKSM